MTRDEFSLVEEIFTELLDATADERERRLARLRPDTGRLVRELLASAERERAEARAELRPRRFGAWETIRRLGRGGMGEVWLARRADGAFEATAAVKLLAGPLQVGDFPERFRQERQILASLDHPNIARLLDGGVSEDRIPYFVMEFIAGSPIDEYLRSHALAVPEKLRLMEQVCRAVSYAHCRLILHRDLKPSNVMVNARGEVKLLDFGTAQLLERCEDRLTGNAGRLLTPPYASPEMVLGKPLAVTSDVWSLGVMLYEMLTGSVPIPSSEVTPERMLRLEPLPMPGIDRDLDAILAKALEPDPNARYAQAEELRADLERWRLGLPVQAQRGTWRYRLGKYVRRHRSRFVMAAAVLGGAASTAHQMYIASRRYESVRTLAESLLTEIFAQTQRAPGSREAQQLLAQRVIEALKPLSGNPSGDPELDPLLAYAHVRLAQLQGDPYQVNIGDVNAALKSLDQAAKLNRGDSPKAILVRARMESARSGILMAAGRKQEATASARRAFELLGRLPASSASASDRMEVAGFLGDLAAETDPEEAERHYAQAIQEYENYKALGGQLADAAPLILRLKRGQIWMERDPVRALGEFRAGLELYRSMPKPGQESNRRILANLIRKESNALARLKRFGEARARAAESVRIAEELSEIDPQDRRARFDLVVAYNDQAILLEQAGNLGEARVATMKTLRLLEPMADQGGPTSAFAANLAEVRQRAVRLGMRSSHQQAERR
jgi:non-specific serine/threonine protein kinase/serine/threonine-protein kinase